MQPNTSFLCFIVIILRLIQFSVGNLNVENIENLIHPFNSFCHIHFILKSVNIHFSQQKLSNKTLNYTTFTLRQLTMDVYNISLWFNEYINRFELVSVSNINHDDYFRMGSIELAFTEKEPSADPPISLDTIKFKPPKCILFILLFQEEYQQFSVGTYNNTVYFPYLTALDEIKNFYRFTNFDGIYHIEPAFYQVLHATESNNDNDVLDEISPKTRHDLQSFADFHRDVWIITIQDLKNTSKSATVPFLRPLEDIIIYCYYCWERFSVDETNVKDLYNATGKYIPTKIFKLNNISSSIGIANVWSTEKNLYMDSVNLGDYKLPNTFRLPPNNKLLFEWAILNILLESINGSLFPNIKVHNWESLPSMSGGWGLVGRHTTDNKYLNIYPKFYAKKRLSQDSGFAWFGSMKMRWLTIPVHIFGYNFLTCYSYDYRSWYYYLEPFQLELWVALTNYLPILAVITHITLYLRKMNRSDFNPYFFAYSTIVEYAYGVPDYVFEVRTMRILLGTWLLISGIFTNAYKGIAITGVTAPTDKSSLVWFFDLLDATSNSSMEVPQRVSYNIMSTLSPAYLDIWILQNTNTSDTNENHRRRYLKRRTHDEEGNAFMDDYFTMPFFQDAYKAWTAIIDTYMPYFVDWDFTTGESIDEAFESLLRKDKTWEHFNLVKSLGKHVADNPVYVVPRPDTNPMYSSNYDVAVEREITNCSKKLVYVNYGEKVNQEFEYLSQHYHYNTFFKGNSTLLNVWKVWRFDNPRGSPLPRVFQTLLENGVFRQLEWFYKRQEYSGVRLEYTRSRVEYDREPVKALDLYSNLQTIFFLYLIGILVSILVAVFEPVYKNYRFIMPFIKFQTFEIFKLAFFLSKLMLEVVVIILKTTKRLLQRFIAKLFAIGNR